MTAFCVASRECCVEKGLCLSFGYHRSFGILLWESWQSTTQFLNMYNARSATLKPKKSKSSDETETKSASPTPRVVITLLLHTYMERCISK
mmetsp:Transcript_25618/g.34098  ORF Transcript_25618/g.34098 Transcript_25618/m.34098 type:complete len:91 (-) Transcript_25618:1-273(-)